MNKLHFVLILIALLNLSCKSASKKTFVFANDNQKIELLIPQNQIDLDGETQVKIQLANIEVNSLSVVGVGAYVVSTTKNTMNIKIITRSSFHKDAKEYKLRVSYKKDDERVHHTFYIPLKKS